MGFPWGDSQTFIYDDLTITLEAESLVYQIDTSEGWLKWIGYDRWLDPNYQITPKLSSDGISFFSGPSFTAPYQFEWNLTKLPPETFFTLEAMYLRSQRDHQPIRLIDQRYALSEPAPRIRAKAGTLIDAPTIPGMVFFWGQFDITFKMERDRGLFKTEYDLKMSATEFSPGNPVPTSEDL